MPEKAAASGFTLEVPVDASAISADDLRGQVLKVVVKPCDGELLSETVKLRADGTGSARFSFAKRPGALQVLIGPERAEDAELAASQTITTSVVRVRMGEQAPARRGASPRLALLLVSGGCAGAASSRSAAVSSARTGARSREPRSARTTWTGGGGGGRSRRSAARSPTSTAASTSPSAGAADSGPGGGGATGSGSSSRSWPQAIAPVLERDPRIQLGRAEQRAKPRRLRAAARARRREHRPAARVGTGGAAREQIRTTLLEKLPDAPELAAARTARRRSGRGARSRGGRAVARERAPGACARASRRGRPRRGDPGSTVSSGGCSWSTSAWSRREGWRS